MKVFEAEFWLGYSCTKKKTVLRGVRKFIRILKSKLIKWLCVNWRVKPRAMMLHRIINFLHFIFSPALKCIFFLKEGWKFRACYMGFLPELYDGMPRLFSRTSRHRFRITSSLFASVHLEINMYSLSFLANRSKSNDPGSIASCTTKGWMAKMFAGTTPSINDAWGTSIRARHFGGARTILNLWNSSTMIEIIGTTSSTRKKKLYYRFETACIQYVTKLKT